MIKGRSHPAKGVLILRNRATTVFVTVCSRRHEKVFANPVIHHALLKAWNKADAWLVGAYVIMPDHLHLFCSPKEDTIAIEQWITFWKREVRRDLGIAAVRFQSGSFHHRLRGDESYSEKWEYVRVNPVRAGLVEQASEWPYQGVLHELRT